MALDGGAKQNILEFRSRKFSPLPVRTENSLQRGPVLNGALLVLEEIFKKLENSVTIAG